MPTPEETLKKIRKQSFNTTCANCDATSKVGFGNVCVKYKTFVCNMCKSSHQSYSHRVKSVTMSSWTKSEVAELKHKNGGGNKIARRTWLGKKEAQKHMPKHGVSSLAEYKQFIKLTYEEKAFYVKPGKADDSSDDDEEPTLVKANKSSNKKAGSGEKKEKKRKKSTHKKVSKPTNTKGMVNTSEATADSFDFFGSSSDFNAAPPVATVASNSFEDDFFGDASSNTPAAAAAPSGFVDDFFSAPTPAPTPTKPPAGDKSSGIDDFLSGMDFSGLSIGSGGPPNTPVRPTGGYGAPMVASPMGGYNAMSPRGGGSSSISTAFAPKTIYQPATPPVGRYNIPGASSHTMAPPAHNHMRPSAPAMNPLTSPATPAMNGLIAGNFGASMAISSINNFISPNRPSPVRPAASPAAPPMGMPGYRPPPQAPLSSSHDPFAGLGF